MEIRKIRAYDPKKENDKIEINIYLKPVRPLKYIKVNAVVTKTVISFEK